MSQMHHVRLDATSSQVSPRSQALRVWPPRPRLAVLWLAGVSWASLAVAQADDGARPSAPAALQASVPPPKLRFRRPDKPVKVVLLAGSIGAFRKQPYAWHLQRGCRHIELKNLSETGLGAWALAQKYRQAFLDHRYLMRRGVEHWLLFGGGLNSIGNPEKTNAHLRALFARAHARGVKVVALSPTPWGAAHDRRWRGTAALRYWNATAKVTAFVTGRLSPTAALGRYLKRRPAGAAAWQAGELPEVGIDLFDSALRHRDAAPLSLAEAEAQLKRDPKWRQRFASGPGAPLDAQREARDAKIRWYAQLPQWYLRPEWQAFDPIHPNAQGHARIARIACPKLPSSWGCHCE